MTNCPWFTDRDQEFLSRLFAQCCTAPYAASREGAVMPHEPPGMAVGSTSETGDNSFRVKSVASRRLPIE